MPEGEVTPMREAVVQRLGEQFAADRLTLEELERRLDLAYQARSTDELAALTVDLPAHASLTTVRPSGASLTHERGAMSRTISATFGNIERRGDMDVPARLEVRARFGNVVLDLREAAFPPFAEIDISCVFSNVEIYLPPGVRVENDGSGVLGSFTCAVTPGAMPMVGTAPVVRLRGRAVFGNVDVGTQPEAS